MKNILFVDDDRVRVDMFCKFLDHDPNFNILWVNSVLRAKVTIECAKDITLVMLDNDLGDGIDVTELAKWIVENKFCQDATFVVHSMNPIGNQRIFNYLNDAGYEVYSIPGAWNYVDSDGQGNLSLTI